MERLDDAAVEAAWRDEQGKFAQLRDVGRAALRIAKPDHLSGDARHRDHRRHVDSVAHRRVVATGACPASHADALYPSFFAANFSSAVSSEKAALSLAASSSAVGVF